VREKRVPLVIVELQVEATGRLVQRENRQAHSTEPPAEEQTLAQATLRWMPLPQALLALAE
jgi:hypothetical protein